jgi:hypothetical protein
MFTHCFTICFLQWIGTKSHTSTQDTRTAAYFKRSSIWTRFDLQIFTTVTHDLTLFTVFVSIHHWTKHRIPQDLHLHRQHCDKQAVQMCHTREAMHESRNTEMHPRDHCCRGKAIGVTYSECVSVALVIQHEKKHAPYYIAACGLSCFTTSFHIIS